MEFHAYALTETSAFVDRLLAARSDAARERIHALREALDAVARDLESPAATGAEMEALAARLREAAEAGLRQAREAADAEIRHAREAMLEEVRQVRGSVDAEIRQARDAADEQIREAREAAAEARHGREAADADAHRTRDEAAAAVAAAREALTFERERTGTLASTLVRAESEITRLSDELHAARERAQGLEREVAAAGEAAAAGQARDAAGHAEQERLAEMAGRAQAEAAHLREELAAERERRDAADRERAVAEAAHHALEQAVRSLESDRTDSAGRLGPLEQQLAEAQAALELTLADVEQLRADRAREASRSAALERERDEARAAAGGQQAAAADLAAALARVQALEVEAAAAGARQDERGALAAQVATAAARIEALEAGLAAARADGGDREDLAGRLEAATARLSEIESAHAGCDERIRDLAGRLAQAGPPTPAADGGPPSPDALQAEVDRMVSLFDASARAVSEMAAVSSSGELLTDLVKRLSLQFSRVLLFRLKGNRLEGEQQIGFEDMADASRIVIPTSVDSILTRAIATGNVESLRGADVAVRSGTPFGGDPTSAVALPITLQGTTVGVVYADDSDMPDAARGPAVHETSVGFARLLAGQVVALLVRHTHEIKTLAELRQYASTLLQEAREMYQADAEAGKADDRLRSRLKDNIDCASQLYAYRAAMEGTAAAALLDQQIAEEMEAGTPFARDLAAVVGDLTAADVQLTAEAS